MKKDGFMKKMITYGIILVFMLFVARITFASCQQERDDCMKGCWDCDDYCDFWSRISVLTGVPLSAVDPNNPKSAWDQCYENCKDSCYFNCNNKYNSCLNELKDDDDGNKFGCF